VDSKIASTGILLITFQIHAVTSYLSIRRLSTAWWVINQVYG